MAKGKLSLRLPLFSRPVPEEKATSRASSEDERAPAQVPRWSFGVLNDKDTFEVPGSVLLLSNHKNEPLGLRNAPARTSHSSLPISPLPIAPRIREADPKKTTEDGQIILDPQPEDSANDPLNWSSWRRDAALLSLGLYCMVGGGMTPVLAAGFSNVASDFKIPVAHVSLTTGLFMMGMGVGSVFASPTAILYGKRPVYLVSAILFIVTSCCCAIAPNFPSLIVARVFQGIAVSPVECLPSATIAEIYFLHERAFRIGIYTLLLLGGKNLTPLVSASIIQSLSWRWTFWIVAFIVAFCGVLLFLFVPETFWDRTPIPRARTPSRPTLLHRISAHFSPHSKTHNIEPETPIKPPDLAGERQQQESPLNQRFTPAGEHHVKFSDGHDTEGSKSTDEKLDEPTALDRIPVARKLFQPPAPLHLASLPTLNTDDQVSSGTPDPTTPQIESRGMNRSRTPSNRSLRFPWSPQETEEERHAALAKRNAYSAHWRELEAKSFVQQLRPYHGRINNDSWLKAAVRPFVLFTYPSVLWSAAIYSCSVGWLIVVSESVSVIYRSKYYHFDALQTGLFYISPFIGGVLGTAVAGKVSDIIVKAMARRNGGLYEPEFRLVMAIPIAITTIMGLMGYGWSAQARDQWIVPTIFIGIISFGCSLGSTTAITFCVDSYRQYAGEALVTLNFSKNIFHGLVFGFFLTEWVEEEGSKRVFIWLGTIQLIFLVFSIPMFIFGKRMRMWTIRKNLIEKF